MKILAIETSCDDTGIAILEVKNKTFTVLSNIVSSQQIHANYGGVFPMMAKREHQANLVPTLIQALKEAKLLKPAHPSLRGRSRSNLVEAKNIASRHAASSRLKALLAMTNVKKILEKEQTLFEQVKEFLETNKKPDVDFIAVTHGPGLEPCLYVGVNFAKALSYFWDIPIIPVNHIEAHILVNFLENKNITFPAISLVVSGGHTQLILVKKIGNYQIIGETRDDAAGECFDKAARILGLGYPGGPIISKIASEFDLSSLRAAAKQSNLKISLPRPMMHSKDYDFSFSGLKTAVLYAAKGKELTKEYVEQMCFEVQNAICEVLIKKTLQAAKDYNAKTIILGGGVSANQELRKQFIRKSDLPVIFPDPKLSTDNGLMIAVAASFHRTKKIAHSKRSGRAWQKLSVNANLRVKM